MNGIKSSIITASKRGVHSGEVHDLSQENQQKNIDSSVKPEGKLYSISKTRNMSLIEGLDHSLLLSKEEENISVNSTPKLNTGSFPTSEEEQRGKAFLDPSFSLTLSSALALSTPTSKGDNAPAIVTPVRTNIKGNDSTEDNKIENEVDFNSFLPMMPAVTPPSNDKSVFPLSPGEKRLSIENQYILVNGLIAKSLTESIYLMESMRHQSQKIRRQVEDIEVLSSQLFVDLKSNDEGMRNSTKNLFSSWEPPTVPFPETFPQHRRKRPSGKVTFPLKLHQLLLDLEHIEDGSSVAAFLPDGMAFVIKDVSKFEEIALKRYFPKMKNFSSFHRQLNLYNFRRLGYNFSIGKAKGAYSHILFRRNQPLLAGLMKPTRIKNGTSSTTDAAIASLKKLSCEVAKSDNKSFACNIAKTN